MQLLRAGIFVAALLASAEADALRCDRELITKGDRAVEVKRHCGEPIAVEKRYVPRTVYARRGRVVARGWPTEVVVEEWTYNFGPKRLMRVIRLENGVVKDIEPLGYGFLEKDESR